jgi:hypothetical protein
MFIRAIFLLTAMMLVTFAMSARANNKVIYGVDDRREVFEVTNNQYTDLAIKTAAMIPVDKIKIDLQEVKITGKTLSSKMNICPTERFADQINPAMCSGFLVIAKMQLLVHIINLIIYNYSKNNYSLN